MGQRAAEKQAEAYEDHATDSQTVACPDKHVDALAEATGEQRGGGTAEGIEDDHAVTQPCEAPTVRAS